MFTFLLYGLLLLFVIFGLASFVAWMVSYAAFEFAWWPRWQRGLRFGWIGTFFSFCMVCIAVVALAFAPYAKLFILAPTQTTYTYPQNGYENSDQGDTWDGNLAGPEMTLPDRVVGPAIINFWDQKTYCGTLRLNAGEVWDNGFVGAYWEFQNQSALVDRFPHHATEYKADTLHVNCVILYSVDELRDR